MTQTATVNYHVHKPERQAFELDAGGITGNLISPELAPTQVPLHDVRKSRRILNFENASVAFATRPSKVKAFTADQHWAPTYDAEIAELLRDQISATDVIVFDHTVRIDDPDAVRKPARNVHSDYSRDGAAQRLVDILGEDKAAVWADGHYAFVNIWRPIEDVINSAPLGFILPNSVADEDWVLLDLIYPDRVGQIMGLAANADHQWVYMSQMTPDDVALFNIYDNQGRPSIAHSALDMIEDPTVSTVRKSIETRTLVRY